MLRARRARLAVDEFATIGRRTPRSEATKPSISPLGAAACCLSVLRSRADHHSAGSMRGALSCDDMADARSLRLGSIPLPPDALARPLHCLESLQLSPTTTTPRSSARSGGGVAPCPGFGYGTHITRELGYSSHRMVGSSSSDRRVTSAALLCRQPVRLATTPCLTIPAMRIECYHDSATPGG